jgi:hypothetical protein
MDRFNETQFNGFIGQQSVTPLTVPFWCGASQGSDFSSSDPIKFGGSTWALLLVDDVHAEGLKSATDVEAGAAADFDSGHDFCVGVVFVGEKQDASTFDGANTRCAFAGEVFELAALFFGQSYLVRFFCHVIAYPLVRRCTERKNASRFSSEFMRLKNGCAVPASATSTPRVCQKLSNESGPQGHTANHARLGE